MSAASESQKLHRQTLEGLIARAEKQLRLSCRKSDASEASPEAKAARQPEASYAECFG